MLLPTWSLCYGCNITTNLAVTIRPMTVTTKFVVTVVTSNWLHWHTFKNLAPSSQSSLHFKSGLFDFQCWPTHPPFLTFPTILWHFFLMLSLHIFVLIWASKGKKPTCVWVGAYVSYPSPLGKDLKKNGKISDKCQITRHSPSLAQ